MERRRSHLPLRRSQRWTSRGPTSLHRARSSRRIHLPPTQRPHRLVRAAPSRQENQEPPRNGRDPPDGRGGPAEERGAEPGDVPAGKGFRPATGEEILPGRFAVVLVARGACCPVGPFAAGLGPPPPEPTGAAPPVSGDPAPPEALGDAPLASSFELQASVRKSAHRERPDRPIVNTQIGAS